MYMSKSEICTLYRESGQTPTQIEILADLNACSLTEIVNVLADSGYTINNKYDYILHDEALVIRGKEYTRPLTMSHSEWYKYKQKIKKMQIEQEALLCKVADISHTLNNEIEFITKEHWRAEYE